MWSKFTEYAGSVAEIVAPPDGEDMLQQPTPSQLGDELWSRFANIVVPPTSEGMDTNIVDEDEQERYICELERALLQKKKQNETLEKRVRGCIYATRRIAHYVYG